MPFTQEKKKSEKVSNLARWDAEEHADGQRKAGGCVPYSGPSAVTFFAMPNATAAGFGMEAKKPLATARGIVQVNKRRGRKLEAPYFLCYGDPGDELGTQGARREPPPCKHAVSLLSVSPLEKQRGQESGSFRCLVHPPIRDRET